jgi:tetratricopeptide (TPR) repeat protein
MFDLHDPLPVPTWRRVLAQGWYLWGLSLCYWGNHLRDVAWYRGGVGAFDHAAQLNPAHARAILQRGVIYGRELNAYRRAVADLTTALALRPSWDEAYLQRGLFHRFAGAHEAALSDLERYLELGRDEFWRAEAQRQIAALREEA